LRNDNWQFIILPSFDATQAFIIYHKMIIAFAFGIICLNNWLNRARRSTKRTQTNAISEKVWHRETLSKRFASPSLAIYYSGQLIVLILCGGVPHLFAMKIFHHDMRLHLAFT
jgi:hypothetical protein